MLRNNIVSSTVQISIFLHACCFQQILCTGFGMKNGAGRDLTSWNSISISCRNDFYKMDKIVKLIQEKERQFMLKMALSWLDIISEIPCEILTYFAKVKGIFPRNGTVKPGFEERRPLIFHSDRPSLIVLAHSTNPWICCLEYIKRKIRRLQKRFKQERWERADTLCCDIYCTTSNSFYYRLHNFR